MSKYSLKVFLILFLSVLPICISNASASEVNLSLNGKIITLKNNKHHHLGVYIFNNRVNQSQYDGDLYNIFYIGKGRFDVLLQYTTFAAACPALFKIMYIGKTGYRFSKSFGSCTDNPLVRYSDPHLIVKFKPHQEVFFADRKANGKIEMDTYVFNKWHIVKKYKTNYQSVEKGGLSSLDYCKETAKRALNKALYNYWEGIVHPQIEFEKISGVGAQEGKNGKIYCTAHGKMMFNTGKIPYSQVLSWSGEYTFIINHIYSNKIIDFTVSPIRF